MRVKPEKEEKRSVDVFSLLSHPSFPSLNRASLIRATTDLSSHVASCSLFLSVRRLPGRSEVFPLLELFTLGFAFEISEYGVVPYKTCKRICTATGLLGILGHSLEAPPTCLNSRGALGGDSKSFTLTPDIGRVKSIAQCFKGAYGYRSPAGLRIRSFCVQHQR